MSQFHSIRLHGPWTAQVFSRDDGSPTPTQSIEDDPRKIKIPADWGDWLGTDFRGRVLYQRTFGLPTELGATQRVWLVVDEVDARGNVTLNDHPLGSVTLGQPLRVEIRSRLQRCNRLAIVVELPADAQRGSRQDCAGGLIGSVRLEIEE